jgi:hypothetical protein
MLLLFSICENNSIYAVGGAANTYGEIGVAPGKYRSRKQGQELSQCDNK